MTEDSPAPAPSPKIDSTVPHSARIWNYWLGGKDNFAIDREVGDQFRKIFPDIVGVARASRGFMVRSVRYLAAEAGIRQFLDIFPTLPLADNTHEVAQAVAPASRIVYVDSDRQVLVYARALLTSGPAGATEYVEAGVREPDRILRAAARTSLDFTQPVALLLNGALGHVPDDTEAHAIVRRLLGGVPSGSYLVFNESTNVVRGAEFAEAMKLWNVAGSAPYCLRGPEQIASFFDGLELVEPGVVSCPRWRPDPGQPAAAPDVDAFGGVGRKP